MSNGWNRSASGTGREGGRAGVRPGEMLVGKPTSRSRIRWYSLEQDEGQIIAAFPPVTRYNQTLRSQEHKPQ